MSNEPFFARERDELAAAARKAAGDYRLMQCSSGNLSWRVDDEHMLITASRSWMAELRPDEVALLRLSDGSVLNGVRPSVETRFHRGILDERRDISVVLHFQTPAATAIACRADLGELNFFVTPEIPYYIGPIGVVPFIQPGSPDLAEAVVPVMREHNLCVLANHGLVCVGTNFDLAIQAAVFFEMACRIILDAGERLRPLGPEDVAELVNA